MNERQPPLTDHAQMILARSVREAERLGCEEPCAGHLLLAVPGDEMTFARYLLEEFGIDIERAHHTLEAIYQEGKDDPSPADTMEAVVEKARRYVKAQRHPFLGSEHLLLSCLQLAGPVLRLMFARLGVRLGIAEGRAESLIQRYGRGESLAK